MFLVCIILDKTNCKFQFSENIQKNHKGREAEKKKETKGEPKFLR